MLRHGLADQIRILPGGYTEESGATAARHILSEEHLPTAIFAANDRCAHGVLDTLTRARIDVPGDMSVVGYDDSEIARLSFIDLITVRQDAALMAERAVQAIIEGLDHGRVEARDIVLDPTLIVRGTTGPPRSGQASKVT
jgi:DNA-binding LacI/PurR family transcriptional regulator